jgi:hypothetical protein
VIEEEAVQTPEEALIGKIGGVQVITTDTMFTQDVGLTIYLLDHKKAG